MIPSTDQILDLLLIFISYCVFFVALRPKSTAMVMAEWSVHQITIFPWQA